MVGERPGVALGFVVAAAVGMGAVAEAMAAALGLVKVAAYQIDSLLLLRWATIVELIMDWSSAFSSL